MTDPQGARPTPLPPSDPGWPLPDGPRLPDRGALLARLAATGWVRGAGRDEFRRGCHALVTLAGIAGDSPLEQAARQWLERTEDTGADVPEPALRAALSDDAQALVAALRARPAPPGPPGPEVGA